MRLIRSSIAAVGLAALIVSAGAQASIITYDVTDLGGGAWRYDYTVTNDTLAVPIEQITIYFELGLYTNLRNATAPANWEPLAVDPDSLLPDDGFFDALVLDLVASVAPGDTLSGFSVEFDYLPDDLTPGSQLFELLIAPLTVVDVGFTRLATAVAVSEPGSAPLLGAGLLLLVAGRWRRALSRPESR